MLSLDEVRHIAKLACLSLSDDDVRRYAGDLNALLEHIEVFKKLNVADVTPMSHVHGVVNRFRDDTVEESLPFEELKKIAPDTSGRFIRVPIILNEE